MWPDVVIALLAALIGGFLGATFKLYKEAEVRNRQGDFSALSILRRLGKLFGSRVHPSYNYTSDNTTKAQTRLHVKMVNEKISTYHSQLIDAAARSSSKFRKDLYLVGVRLDYLDPIHVVQLMIANAEKINDLPPGGLREYLIGERIENESRAHLEIARFLVFTDRLSRRMNKHHFKAENVDIEYLTRLEETEETEIRASIRELVAHVSEELSRQQTDSEIE